MNFNADANYLGIDLSYTEAMSFVAYLIDQNGVEDLFNFIRSDESYEEHYGKSYDELKSEWIDYLKI